MRKALWLLQGFNKGSRLENLDLSVGRVKNRDHSKCQSIRLGFRGIGIIMGLGFRGSYCGLRV